MTDVQLTHSDMATARTQILKNGTNILTNVKRLMAEIRAIKWEAKSQVAVNEQVLPGLKRVHDKYELALREAANLLKDTSTDFAAIDDGWAAKLRGGAPAASKVA